MNYPSLSQGASSLQNIGVHPKSLLNITYLTEPVENLFVVKYILLNYEYILIMKFINRSQELAFLQRKYTSNKAEFIIIYGRRRIGKTELINKFSEHRPTLYFLGRTESKTDTLRRFNLMLMEHFEDISLVRSPLSSLKEVI